MKTMTIVLPWPSELLNPNKRPSRHQKAAKAKQARRDAGFAAHSAVVRNHWPKGVATIEVQPIFFSPDNDSKPRDKDNYSAMLKSTYDGLADAKVVVNDKGLTPLPPKFETSRDKRLELIVTDTSEPVRIPVKMSDPPPEPDFGPDFVRYDIAFDVVRRTLIGAQAIGFMYEGERQSTVVRLADGKYERWDSGELLGEFYKCGSCSQCVVLQSHTTTCPHCSADDLENMAIEPTMGPNVGKIFDFTNQEWVPVGDPLFLAIEKVLSDTRRLTPLIGSMIQNILEANKATPEAAAAESLAPKHLVPVIRALPAMLELIKQFGRA